MIAFTGPKQQVQAYIEGVLSGEIVAGKYVRLAVERHLLDLEHAWERGYKFDENIATRACCFSPMCCRHSVGEWAGERLELSNWQSFCDWVLYGWRRIDNGLRRFRRAYETVARKNGKTTRGASRSLYAMFADEPFEPGAQIFVAATKEDQAKILYRDAVNMVKASPTLTKQARIRKAPPSITWERHDSFFRPLGSDSEGTDGLNPHMIVEDELHAWVERHRPLKEKLATGGGARRQPLELMITTAGDDRSELWKEEDEYAVRVLESVLTGNIIDDTYFAFIARIDEEDDPFDEACWAKANPNLGVSVKLDYLREAANRAKHKPSETNQFIRYHCNRAVAASTREITAEDWLKGSAALTIDGSAYGHGGLDVGRTNDWAAIAACFPIPDGDKTRYEVKAKAWTVKHGEFPVDREPFRTWISKGLLEVCDGDQVDFMLVENEMVAWSEQYQLLSWAFDPANARLLADRLQNVHGLTVFSFTQSHKHYNEPCTRFVEELRAGRVSHGNEPVLAWQAGNVMFNRNHEGLVKPDKTNRMNKIDGMVALFMAFSECLFAEKKYTGGSLFVTT